MHTQARVEARLVHFLFLLGLLFGLTLSAGVRAEEDPRKAARAHYEQGLSLANRGAYEAALREFRSAYQKSPQFAVLYNIGQAEIAIGHPLEAIQALSQYLRDGQDQIPPVRRQQVEAQIALLEKLLAEIVVTSEQPGALVSVDGRELGTTPLTQPLRVTTGPHEVSLSYPGFPPAKRSVALSEGERRVLHFDRPQAATPVVAPNQAHSSRCPEPVRCPALPPAKPLERRQGRGTKTTVGFVLVGAGAVLGTAAVGHYFWNRGRYDDWSAEQAALDAERGAIGYEQRQTANNELAESIDRASAVTVSLALGGAALAAGGVVLIVVDGGESRERGAAGQEPRDAARLRLDVSPSGLTFSGAF
jgi:tetratricopeptide (TPR) repeat protein